jgi:monothiol glutaredoxin
MKTPRIVAYLRPAHKTSDDIRALFREYGLAFDECNLAIDDASRSDVMRRTGHAVSPSVEIDGRTLADVSAMEVEVYLLTSGLVRAK